MARPGFVLDVDDRTPPVLVASDDTFRLERLPAGARVVYPADSLPAVHAADAIAGALDAPVGSDPLTDLALLRIHVPSPAGRSLRRPADETDSHQ